MDDVKHGGGWRDNLSRLETNYIGKLPLPFARGMAGFKDKPFHLERNVLKPSLALQRNVFPWIEGIYGENENWRIVCDREMNEYDENYDDGQEAEDVPEFNMIEEDGQGSQVQNQQQQQQSNVQIKVCDINKRGFLKLLVRLRRVILQDAATMLFLNRPNELLKTEVFASSEFQAFKGDVFSVLSEADIPNRLQEYEGLVPEIVNAQRELSGSAQQINN